MSPRKTSHATLRSLSLRRKAGQVSVAIVGGGAAGLWLAHHLSERNRSVVLFDQHPMAAFSSTRNQGWLHTGTLYAAYGASDMALRCQENHSFLLDASVRRGLGGITRGHGAHFLTESQLEMEMVLERCRALRIPVTLSRNTKHEPILEASGPLQQRFGVRADDCVVHSTALLSWLLDSVTRQGGQVQIVPTIDELRLERQGGHWNISSGEVSLDAVTVVLACGVAIPRMAMAIGDAQLADLFMITRTRVWVIHRPVSSTILVPLLQAGPHLVPFFDDGPSPVGATVCLAFDNQSTQVDMKAEEVNWKPLTEALLRSYPGLRELLRRGGPAPAHSYTCEKLQLRPANQVVDRSWRTSPVEWSRQLPNLLAFYAGKFSTAPLDARDCADEIVRVLDSVQVGSKPRQPSPNKLPRSPMIAQRPYVAAPTHVLTATGSTIEARPR